MAEEKVILARRLCQETTMSLKWLAQPLQMGSWTRVFNLLNRKSQTISSAFAQSIAARTTRNVHRGTGREPFLRDPENALAICWCFGCK
jgi:hypothetical protein